MSLGVVLDNCMCIRSRFLRSLVGQTLFPVGSVDGSERGKKRLMTLANFPFSLPLTEGMLTRWERQRGKWTDPSRRPLSECKQHSNARLVYQTSSIKFSNSLFHSHRSKYAWTVAYIHVHVAGILKCAHTNIMHVHTNENWNLSEKHLNHNPICDAN